MNAAAGVNFSRCELLLFKLVHFLDSLGHRITFETRKGPWYGVGDSTAYIHCSSSRNRCWDWSSPLRFADPPVRPVEQLTGVSEVRHEVRSTERANRPT